MAYTRENLPKRAVKLTLTVSTEELQPHLEAAAVELSKEVKIEGFRPGNAPYQIVKNKVGEMKIYEAALDPVIQKTLVDAVEKEDLHSVGSPDVKIEKLAPGNPLVYTVVLALMPEITRLADLKKLSIEGEKVVVDDKKIEGALRELQKMQTTEKRVNRPATMKDKIVVDLAMAKDKVPVEGGETKDHVVYMEESYYVPGLREELVGLKEGDKKTFTLKFPETHYQKHLAGANIEYHTTLKGVFELAPPTLDDEFAKKLGKQTITEIHDLIKQNMTAEALGQADRATEIKLLELMADKSEFTEIPDSLIQDETEKMILELKQEITSRGIAFEDYVKNIKKTPEELKKNFLPQAEKRIKVALVLAKTAHEFKIEPSEQEVDEALDKLATNYQEQEIKDRIYSPEYREYERVVVRNRQTIARLKEIMVR